MRETDATLSPAQIAEAAQLLLRARRSLTVLERLPPGCVPASIEDAEAICEAMAQEFERPLGGWKIGCLDPSMPIKQGLPRPFCGQIPAFRIYRSGATVAHKELLRAVIEPEIAFRLRRDLAPRAGVYERGEIVEAVGALCPVIEIPESRLSQRHPHGALGMVADQGYAGRLVEGSPCFAWRKLDLPSLSAVVTLNDTEVARGAASRAMGNPLEALLWLANHRRARGDGLRAGQIISTGSMTGVIPVKPCDRVVADFGALGRVEVFID